MEYGFRRRNDSAVSGLTYTIETTTKLASGTWSANEVLDAVCGSVNEEIDSVTNCVFTEGQPEQFIRLKVE